LSRLGISQASIRKLTNEFLPNIGLYEVIVIALFADVEKGSRMPHLIERKVLRAEQLNTVTWYAIYFNQQVIVLTTLSI
jgi:hypothetical protein